MKEQIRVREISISFKDWLQDLELLVKFRLSSFVVFSSAIAYCIAAGSDFNMIRFMILVMGGALITFSANILNEVLEADYDRMMERTANRPLAAKRWSTSSAIVLAGITCLVGIVLLALLNPLTSFLGMLSLVTYAFLYTPLKRYSTAAVAVGAIPGALPVMIGMIAHDGVMTPEALFLFAVQFLWQFPHFWSIGFLSFEQYQYAGYKLLPEVNGGVDRKMGVQSIVYTALLFPLLIFGYVTGIVSMAGMVAMILLSGYFMWRAWMFQKHFDKVSARRLMFSSFIFLPAALLILWWSM